ncbi:hypothetical protein C8R45DRAFT_934590 [Mycena sanguinolenta]|nr:hypothetical protein C8R45DRAFT_934590 [Mycena sanguinolenta]
MFSLTKLSLSTLALAAAAYAQAGISTGGLSVIVHGAEFVVAPTTSWTCAQTTYTDLTVWINNSDTTLLSVITPLISIEQNFNCDFLVSGELITMPVGTGYTIVLSDPANVTNSLFCRLCLFCVALWRVGRWGWRRVEASVDGTRWGGTCLEPAFLSRFLFRVATCDQRRCTGAGVVDPGRQRRMMYMRAGGRAGRETRRDEPGGEGGMRMPHAAFGFRGGRRRLDFLSCSYFSVEYSGWSRFSFTLRRGLYMAMAGRGARALPVRV